MNKVLTIVLTLCLGGFAFAGDDCQGKCDGEKAAKKADCCEGEKDVKKSDCCEGEKAAKAVKQGECEGGKCDGEKAAAKKAKAQVALSVRIGKWQEGAKKGCKESKAALAALNACLETKDLAKDIAALEAYAAKGCKESAAKLAKLEAALPHGPVALSLRVKHWKAAAAKGCKESLAALEVVKTETKAGCPDSAFKAVSDLETMAGKGCAKSKATLASIEVALKASMAKTAPKKDCGDCDKAKGDCGDCGKAEQKKAGCDGCKGEQKKAIQ
ncbi:MAG: hypothetical protein AB7T09_15915 [Planctomycetota bacterium]